MADKPRLRMELGLEVLPLDQVYQDREKVRQEQEWQSLVGQGQPEPEGPSRSVTMTEEDTEDGKKISVDVSEENMARQADEAALAQGFQRGMVPPSESLSEQVRNRSEMDQPVVRQGVDTVLRTLTGVGLDELQQAIEQGTLPEKVSLNLMDPAGRTVEAVAKETALQSGLPDDVASKVATASGLLAGVLFPPGGAGKGKKLKGAAEALEGAFTPKDPHQLERFVRSKGGIAPSATGDLVGEYATLPLRFKNKKGMSAERMAEAIAEATGQPYTDADLLADLGRLQRSKAEKAARDATYREAARAFDEGATEETVVERIAAATKQTPDEVADALATLKDEPAASGIVAIVDRGLRTTGPERRISDAIMETLARIVNRAGGVAEAKRAVLDLPTGATEEVVTGAGARMRLSRKEQSDLLEYAFPEIEAAAAKAAEVPRGDVAGAVRAGAQGAGDAAAIPAGDRVPVVPVVGSAIPTPGVAGSPTGQVAEAAAQVADRQMAAGLRTLLGPPPAPPRGGRGGGPPPSGSQPPLGPTPGGVSNVNVRRVDATPHVKRVMQEVNAAQSERLAGPRQTVTHGQTIQEASGFSLDDVLTFDPETVDQRALQTALRDYYNAAATKLVDLAKGVKEGTVSGDALAAAYALTGELAVRDELVGKGFARGLESRKIMSKAERASIAAADMADLANRLALSPDADPVLLAERLLALETKTQRTGYVRNVVSGLKHGQDLLYDAWINWILSGPQTHVANIGSTAIVTGWAPAERLLSATLDLGALAGHRSVFFGEVPSMVYGTVAGFRDGVRLAGRALREGVSGFGPEKAERINVWPSDRWGKDSVIGNALDFVYGVFKLGGGPTRALVVEDAFFKGLNYQMELHALAWREAALQGLTGKEFYRHMGRILDNPPPAVKTRAENFALVQTLNQELSELGRIGEIGSAAMRVADLVPLGRTAAPFIRTPTNELHMVAERFPVLGALLDTMRADLMAGGERRALALGKQGTGALVVAAIGMYGTAPIDPDNPIPYMTRITGGGPKNKSERDNLEQNGWRPYAVWDPATKEYHRLSRLGPLATVLTASMDAVEISAHARQTASTFLFATVNAVGRTMLDKSYFSGLANFFDSMQGNAGDVSRFVRSMERSVVPAGVRQFEAAISPERASTLTSASSRGQFDPMWREWEQFKNEVVSTLPYLSESLPPRLNRWGDPVTVPPGWGPDLISPIATGSPKNDPVLNELIKHRITLPVPSPYVDGAPEPSPFSVAPDPTRAPGVQLEPDEYYRYTLLAGKGGAAPNVKATDPMFGRPSLYEAIRHQVELPEWSTFSRWEKDLRVKSIARAYDKLALKQLRQERPDLDALLRAHVQEEAEKKLRSTDPRSPNNPMRTLMPGGLTR